jgi:iron(III) transport system substrate-binding protein
VSDSAEPLKTRLVRALKRPAVQLVLLFVLWCIWFFARQSRDSASGPLVVYCSHDAVFSEAILRDFEKRTGIPVSLRFDTEATKSLGLTELLIREKNSPRCDVFWNNELLGMMDLEKRGLLLPYQGPGYTRIPAAYKAPDGSWTGFAARLRVTISNTGKIGSASPNLTDALPDSDYPKVAIAKPLYGTTLTHYAALWSQWGRNKLIAWHRDWREKGVKEGNGNGAVKDLVAEGVCNAGYCDTDDFFEAKDDGKPVAMHPVRLEDGKTIAIPNTVAIIRGTKRLEAARKLVDFLLSAETELALARSKARQVPLGPVPASELPADVRDLAEWAKDSIDLRPLAPARTECLEWLKSEYAGQ